MMVVASRKVVKTHVIFVPPEKSRFDLIMTPATAEKALMFSHSRKNKLRLIS